MGTAFQMLWELLQKHTHVTPTGAAAPSVELQMAQLIPGVHLTSEVLVK